MEIRRALIAFSLLTLAACNPFEPRVDTSSPAALQASMQRIETKLTTEQRADFRAGLLALTFEGQSDNPILAAALGSPAVLASPAAARIRNKTGPEVIREGLRARITQLEVQIRQDADIVAQAHAERTRNAATFGAIRLENPRYRYGGSFISEPILAFSVTNGSRVAIRRLDLQATVRSPGRTLAWAQDGLNYEFPGGLEPGETRALELTSYNSVWSGPEWRDRTDLALSLEIQNIQTADGAYLIPGDPTEVAAAERRVTERTAEKA